MLSSGASGARLARLGVRQAVPAVRFRACRRSAAALWLLLRKDAASLRLSLSVQPGGREGEPLTICLKVSSPRVLHVARSVYLDITMHNRLLGETRQRDMVLSLAGSENRYTYTAKPPCCGEVVLSCEDAGLCDLLHLFRRKLRPFREVRTVIYPRPLELDVTHVAAMR